MLIKFGVTGSSHDYNITTATCSKAFVRGKTISSLVVWGIDARKSYSLPKLLTNDFLPDSKNEVATPKIVMQHTNIAHLAGNFQELDPEADVLLLLGRDCSDVMYTRCYDLRSPFAHHTALGWAVVGPVCFDVKENEATNSHRRTYKTAIHHDHFSAESTFSPKEKYSV